MSEWHYVEDDDIEIDLIAKQVNMLVTHNDFGNVYVTLEFEKVRKMCRLISQGATDE